MYRRTCSWISRNLKTTITVKYFCVIFNAEKREYGALRLHHPKMAWHKIQWKRSVSKGVTKIQPHWVPLITALQNSLLYESVFSLCSNIIDLIVSKTNVQAAHSLDYI